MTNDIGRLGEELVACWLQAQGWSVLCRRWHCRWGEIDLVAQQSPTQSQAREHVAQATLAFVEVKTRSQGSWDAQGLLAITPRKQAKLWKTAQLFLAQHPVLADLPCRFDVALVRCMQLPSSVPLTLTATAKDLQPHLLPLSLGQPVRLAGYQFTLQTYIESAFYI